MLLPHTPVSRTDTYCVQVGDVIAETNHGVGPRVPREQKRPSDRS